MKEHHIDCSGMGILQVAEILKDLESKGQVAEMTVVAVKSDGSSDGQWHSYFRLQDWNELKDSINSRGSAVTDVWITAADQNKVQFLREGKEVEDLKNTELYKTIFPDSESKNLREDSHERIEKPHRCCNCGCLISAIDYEDFDGYCEDCAVEIIEEEESDNPPFRESKNFREDSSNKDSFWKDFSTKVKKYLPEQGQGDTKATQAVTATMKLVYKWFNDGDVFDNTYYVQGWANDLSSYANWLTNYVEGAYEILRGIKDCYDGDDYKALLKKLVMFIMDDNVLPELNQHKAYGSIYDCDGPFKFKEPFYDEDDMEYLAESRRKLKEEAEVGNDGTKNPGELRCRKCGDPIDEADYEEYSGCCEFCGDSETLSDLLEWLEGDDYLDPWNRDDEDDIDW